MLFQTDDITKGWTGRQGSREAPMGVYIWTCTYNVVNGTKKLAKGTVVLMR
jgi:hypothetical protein